MKSRLAPQTERSFWLSLSAKQRRNPRSWPPHVYQDLITRYDWSVKEANQVEGKFETHFQSFGVSVTNLE